MLEVDMIPRQIGKQVLRLMHKNRAIIIYGARRTGKTTLIRDLMQDMPNALFINGDYSNSHNLLSFRSEEELRGRFSKYRYLIVDEAQRIVDIGLKLKAIIDALPELQVLATGSSSLDLSNYTTEPLTGRKFEYILSPFSTAELYDHDGITAAISNLHLRLIYGNYPEVYLNPADAEEILMETAGSYLFKDVLTYQDIKRPDLMKTLLKALALQVGSQVSFAELGSIVGLDVRTVERYIYFMEQSFIVFRLGSYSRNVRNELKRSSKIYFWDNGIRNAVIGDFKPLDSRQDVGSLWENYFISERRKYLLNARQRFDQHFWRTTQRQEIDLIELIGDQMAAYELKWNPRKKSSAPLTFTRNYPGVDVELINCDNYLPWLLPKPGPNEPEEVL
jgi:predicted AAA+ superfamily ATPase